MFFGLRLLFDGLLHFESLQQVLLLVFEQAAESVVWVVRVGLFRFLVGRGLLHLVLSSPEVAAGAAAGEIHAVPLEGLVRLPLRLVLLVAHAAAAAPAQVLLEAGELLLLVPLLGAVDKLPEADLEGLELAVGDPAGGHPLQTLPEHRQYLRVHLLYAVPQPDAIVPQDFWVTPYVRVQRSSTDSRCTYSRRCCWDGSVLRGCGSNDELGNLNLFIR